MRPLLPSAARDFDAWRPLRQTTETGAHRGQETPRYLTRLLSQLIAISTLDMSMVASLQTHGCPPRYLTRLLSQLIAISLLDMSMVASLQTLDKFLVEHLDHDLSQDMQLDEYL